MENSEDNTVYILDSYGLIFRCYFAFISRPLTNSRGENISALFGFFRNLHWILQHYQPKYLFAAMDSKTKTFRHEKYKEYKATRNKTPDDLHAQIPWIEDILKTLGIPVLQCDGYEADDVIATVAKICENQGRQCRILSGDKDLMQLVTENTKILKPESGASTWKLTGIDGVEAEWGVKPDKLLDLLSLYGDTADNVPGVKGVGVKTAAKLLADYGDLTGIYQNLDKIKGAMQQKLKDGKENAFFSQDLIRLCYDVPCPEILTALNNPPYTFDYKNTADLLSKYEAFAVAKSYAELGLGGESLPLASTSLAATPSSGTNEIVKKSRNAQNFAEENHPQLLEVKQNDTSSYKAITELPELEKFISDYLEKAKSTKSEKIYQELPIAFDSETDSLDTLNANLIGFSLCYEKTQAVYIPVQQGEQDLFTQTNYISLKDSLNQLLRLFSSDSALVIMHNAKFDLKVLISNFQRFPEFNKNSITENLPYFSCKLADTMIAYWLSNPERLGKNGYSLEYLGETVLGLKGIEFSDIVEKGQTFADVPLDKAYPYGAEDADFTLQLWEKTQVPASDYYDLFLMEMNILPILTRMELEGIHLNAEELNKYNQELTKGIAEKESEIYKEVGHEFNIASPKQLQTVLFEERHLTPGKKTKTGYSTDTSVLEELAYEDPVPKLILDYREMAKLQSTYVETLPKLTDVNGRIHTDFVQTGTATGRLSCREPNLQNIPVKSEAGRKIRSAFTAPEGKVLISADYAQIELVVLAHLSGDKNMSNSFINGTDVHKATAAMIYGVSEEGVTPEMRRTAKTINFGVIYGMSAFRLAKDLGISRTMASGFIDNYFRLYSSINSFITNTVQKAEETGYVETILGRKRPVLNINSRNKIEKSAAERIAVNSPVQGSAADIVKKAMLGVNAALKENNSSAKLLLQVHDELIFECNDNPEEIEKTVSIIKNQMENAVKLNVPLKVSVEYGKNWGLFH